MKKLLSVILAAALAISCLAMVSFAANESSTHVKADDLFIDFENESDLDYFGSDLGGTVSYSADGGKNGGGALKYVGGTATQTWYAPNLKTDPTKTVFSKACMYQITFDVYFDTLPSDNDTGFGITFRYNSGTSTTANVSLTTTTTTNIPAKTWTTVTAMFHVTNAQIAYDNLRLGFDSIGNGSTFYIDNYKIDIPVIDNKPVNGNAEAGTQNWAAFNSNGTVTSVDGGANGTSKAIKYTAGSKYGSVIFDFGNVILDDAPYTGYGAEKYTISFYAKAAEGKGGKFNASIATSSYWDAATLKTLLNDQTITTDSQLGMGSITMTDQWQKFEFEVTVTEAYMNLIKKIYATGTSNFKNAQKLGVRLDGATGAYSTELFDYYIDELTIEKYVEPTPTPVATPVATPEATPASKSKSEVKDQYIFVDFDDEDNIAKYMTAPAGGTISYAADKGKDGSGALYFTGTKAWEAPGLLTEPTETVFSKAGNYTITFDVYFETLPDDNDTGFQMIFRYTGGNTDPLVTSGKGIATGTWATVTAIIPVSDAILAKDALKFCFDSIGNGSAFYLDNLKIEKYLVPNVLENGNAEAGTTGWGVFNGGSVESANGGANNTAKSIKFIPVGIYNSVNYPMGGYILQGGSFNGHGAGVYTISFYAKAEEGNSGKFTACICTDPYIGVAQVSEVLGTEGQDSMLNLEVIELTDEWELFEFEVDLTDYLEKLNKLQEKGLAISNIFVRLDGAQGAFKNDLFPYYIDEFTVTMDSDSETVIEEPTAVTFTSKEDTENPQGCYFITTKGVLSAADVKDGVYSKSFTVKNECDETISLSFVAQTVAKKADGSNTWAGPMTENFIELEPGEQGIIEFEMDVENGQVEVLDAMYDLSTFFYRFDLRINGSGREIPEGTSFTIFCEGADNAAIAAITSAPSRASWDLTIRTNYSPDGDVAPVAFIAVAVVAVLASVAVVVIKKRKED